MTLEDLKQTIDSGARARKAVPPRWARGLSRAAIAAGAGVLMLAAAILFWRYGGSGDPDVLHPVFTQLTPTGSADQPTVSPDGKSFAYVSGLNIFVQNVGGNPINLTKDSGARNFSPAFSPNGDLIAFNSDRDEKSGIWLMGRSGENPRRLTTGGFRPSGGPERGVHRLLRGPGRLPLFRPPLWTRQGVESGRGQRTDHIDPRCGCLESDRLAERPARGVLGAVSDEGCTRCPGAALRQWTSRYLDDADRWE